MNRKIVAIVTSCFTAVFTLFILVFSVEYLSASVEKVGTAVPTQKLGP
jgi:TRAP-type C4-dicarboxylate transport system permease small subunit